MQGAALDALQVFFAALVCSGVPEASAPKLIDALVTAAKSESHTAKQAAAQCVAVLATAEGASQASACAPPDFLINSSCTRMSSGVASWHVLGLCSLDLHFCPFFAHPGIEQQ